MPRASHGHLPCSLVHAALLETSPLCSQTGSFAHLWGPRRRPAHMQARRQRRPRQTPTMMPMTECASKESSGGEETEQVKGRTRPGITDQDFLWLLQETNGLSHALCTLEIFSCKDKSDPQLHRDHNYPSVYPPHWTSGNCGPSPSTWPFCETHLLPA